uniref:NADH dehydrogenase subunit 6 n=1 Tax=Tridacna derasa TaxID=80831 RepID=A0A3G3C738_TRIDE|nr:NADH dehydrogenase subunit 6 [Tridacna derasa]AYP72641.1 NADH dehydrogenase subunit 6 [Tridacna derasa]
MSMVVSLMVFSSCVASVATVHPIPLGCYVFVMTSLCAVLLSIEYSVFMGFCLYMVVVGGLLVVFAYAAALSPAANFNLSFNKVCPGAVVIFVLSMVIGWGYKDLMDTPKNMKEYQYSLGMGFDWGWGVLIVFLAVLLFMVMVSVVDVCLATGEGALVAKGSWSKKANKIGKIF